MEVNKCYYCGSGNYSFYAEENGFHLVKCTQCGLLYVKDRPDVYEISEAHKQGKHTGIKELDMTGSFQPEKVKGYLKVLDELFKDDKSNIHTWLDVGCGHGEFMVAVQQYFSHDVKVKGTEPNIHKQKSARERGLNVNYFNVDHHNDQYDVISLLNVYSHLPDPPLFLRSLKELLKPGGQIILETGDTANLSAEDHYRPFYLPDHLSFASEEVVTGILRQLNFEILTVNKYPYMRFDISTLIKELVKIILPKYRSRISYFLKREKYSKTDMYIKAKLKD